MLSLKESRIMWGWCCPFTGMVLDEAWAATEPYAVQKSTGYFGKRRIAMGEFRAVRVTIEPLSDEEQAKHRAEFEEWQKRREAQERRTQG